MGRRYTGPASFIHLNKGWKSPPPRRPVMSSSLASATGISELPPHRRLSWVSQSGAAIVAPAPSLFAMAASSESLVAANSMLSMSSSFHASSASEEAVSVVSTDALRRVITLRDDEDGRTSAVLTAALVALALETVTRPPRRAREATRGAESATAPCIVCSVEYPRTLT